MSRNVLLIQNDPADAHDVRAALGALSDEPFRLEWARNCADGVERLVADASVESDSGDHFAAILADLFLPDVKGIETFDRIFAAAPQTPVLILSTSSDEGLARLAIQRGAQDYLIKGRLDSYLLAKALRTMIERAVSAEAQFDEKELAQVTLNSIGDAVITADLQRKVTYLNIVAETMTGWSRTEAHGHPIEEVCHIVEGITREPIASPMTVAMRENRTVALTPNCVLIRRDGTESGIEDSVAPIHDRQDRVAGAVMVFHDVSTARALSQRMSYMVQHDNLTDLPNRMLFNDRLVQAISAAQRHRQRMAVLYIDVDHFKHFNDSVGHPIGDRLLQSVAARLLACVRGADTVSRQGGDEFVILLSELANPEDAAVIADKILLALSAFHRIDEHELYLTASIGIAVYPEDGGDADLLAKNADFAMYQAKDAGRNNYQFFESSMNTRAVQRHSIENDMRNAIKRREFALHYQPKMDLEAGTVVGAEALIRWNHPQRGLVSPAEFIPIAEQCGLILPIGRWVLREACRQARAWQDAGLPAIPIAINISAVELRAREFAEGVRSALLETGQDPRYLELELTETFLMKDSAATATVLRALKDLGVRLTLDDFGTGYSSLNYLKRFPIDSLKIDRSFIRDLATDAGDANIVGAVISMGKSLHMRVVAEGVETPDQLKFLRARRCPEGQGHYFSQPLAAGEFVQLLRRSQAEPSFA